MVNTAKRLLVICHDVIGEKMAGPGIRYKNIAEQLGAVANVTLATFSDDKTSSTNGLTVAKTGDSYQKIFDDYQVIFAQWLSGEMLNYAKSKGIVVIFDLYAPVPIEYLASVAFAGGVNADRDLEFSGILETYRSYLTEGDFFVCSNERQRDFWIGFVTLLGKLKPSNFQTEPIMEKIILCPMGIPATPPPKTNLKLRSRIGANRDDFILLWSGGIWDWFDAEVVIRAVEKVEDKRVKLVFLGTQHPNSVVAEMSESKKARRLAEELKLIDSRVFFLEGWIDYDDRASYFMDADAAIYADKESAETRFSHRTRVLDHIWTGLPTVASAGDYLADLLDQKGMGMTVPERTPEAFAKAIKQLATSPKLVQGIKARIDQERSNFTWEKATAQLRDFVVRCQPNQQLEQTTQTTPAQNRDSVSLTRRVKDSIKVLLGRSHVR